MSDRGRPCPPVAGPDELTGREAAVAALTARGLVNKEVAGHLGVTPATVKNHLTRIYRRTGTANRTELARWVWEREGRP